MSDSIRIDYELTLEVLSPLHIGTGIPEKPKFNDEKREVSEIVKGADGKPIIPGTTLKGIIRGIAQKTGIGSLPNLFGEIKTEKNAEGKEEQIATKGDVYFWDATLNDQTSECQPLAEFLKESGLPEPVLNPNTGIFVHTRTAIEHGLGISKTSHLFSAEYIAPRCTFTIPLRIETKVSGIAAEFEELLNHLAGDDGFQMGGDTSAGFGHVKLKEAYRKTNWRIDDCGGLKKENSTNEPLTPQKAMRDKIKLTFRCDGLFYINGPLEKKNEEEIQQKALRYFEKPLIIGSEIKGALRTKYEWKCACEKGSTPDMLCPENIFGSTEKRGCFSIRVTNVDLESDAQTTSVKIDRFSGGAYESALFGADVDLGVKMDVEIYFNNRVCAGQKEAVRAIVDEIKENGIELGHRTNSGFGWFVVEEVAGEEAYVI